MRYLADLGNRVDNDNMKFYYALGSIRVLGFQGQGAAAWPRILGARCSELYV